MLRLDFKNSEELVKELKELHKTQIYFVGGCVRDLLLGCESKDIDLIVPHISMNTLETVLSNYGKVDAVGKSFGVLKFKPEGSDMDYDVSVPRKERSTGDGHKSFDVDMDIKIRLEEDLFRRDFTVNAMAMDLSGNLIDPYNGKEDLCKSKVIRVLNEESFNDDPLRLMRALQFCARFNLRFDKESLSLFHKGLKGIKDISKERISIEFRKGIKTLSSIHLFSMLLISTDMFETLFGDDPTNRRFFALKDLWKINNTKVPNLGEYLFSMGVSLEQATNAMELTSVEMYTMKCLEELEDRLWHIEDEVKGVHMVCQLLIKFKDDFIFTIANDNDLFEVFRLGHLPKSYKDLPVNGNDLMELGYSGIEIRDALDRIIKCIVDKFLTDKTSLKELSKEDLLRFVKM